MDIWCLFLAQSQLKRSSSEVRCCHHHAALWIRRALGFNLSCFWVTSMEFWGFSCLLSSHPTPKSRQARNTRAHCYMREGPGLLPAAHFNISSSSLTDIFCFCLFVSWSGTSCVGDKGFHGAPWYTANVLETLLPSSTDQYLSVARWCTWFIWTMDSAKKLNDDLYSG